MLRLLPIVLSLGLAAATDPWDKYMLSPGKARTLSPRTYHLIPAGSSPPPASNSTAPMPPLPVRLSGKGDAVLFDFGKEVGGITTIDFGATSSANEVVALAYSEALYCTSFPDTYIPRLAHCERPCVPVPPTVPSLRYVSAATHCRPAPRMCLSRLQHAGEYALLQAVRAQPFKSSSNASMSTPSTSTATYTVKTVLLQSHSSPPPFQTPRRATTRMAGTARTA